jgi:hypothetical protein
MAIGKLGSRKVYKDPYIRAPRKFKSDVTIPGIVRPYKFKAGRMARLDSDFILPEALESEILTGYVLGQPASDLEERFAIALREAGYDFIFQYEVHSAYTLPNEGKIIDFIVYDGGTPYPVEIGSWFVHGTPSQQEIDRSRDQILNEILRSQGFQEIIRLEFDHPENLDDAREIVRRLFR